MTEFTHIDDWLNECDHYEDGRSYAMWVFEYFRLPAWKHSLYEKWMKKHKLFCTYEGKPYRVTGASRMGDIWLAKDRNRENGYDLRKSVSDCSDWRPKFKPSQKKEK